jgi:hypothetical protein
MLRNVSCCPANDASGRSSAVADDRIANDMSFVEVVTSFSYLYVVGMGDGVYR